MTVKRGGSGVHGPAPFLRLQGTERERGCFSKGTGEVGLPLNPTVVLGNVTSAQVSMTYRWSYYGQDRPVLPFLRHIDSGSCEAVLSASRSMNPGMGHAREDRVSACVSERGGPKYSPSDSTSGLLSQKSLRGRESRMPALTV